MADVAQVLFSSVDIWFLSKKGAVRDGFEVVAGIVKADEHRYKDRYNMWYHHAFQQWVGKICDTMWTSDIGVEHGGTCL